MKLYSIVYNNTLAPSAFLTNITSPLLSYPQLLRIKTSVDNGIIDYLSMKEGINENIPYIEPSYSQFPLPSDRYVANIDLISQVGSFYFCLTPLITFVIVLTEVVKEKEKKLRQGLTVVGLSHASFWLHWIITGLVFSLICTLSLLISGLSCQYEFFLHTAFPINFMLFFMFSFSMIVFAFFLSTLVKTTKMAYTISYAFVLFAVLMEIVFSNALLTYFLFFNEKSGWVPRLF